MTNEPLTNTQRAVVHALWKLKLNSAEIAFLGAMQEAQVAAEISRFVAAKKHSQKQV